MQNEDIEYLSSDLPAVDGDGDNAATEDLGALRLAIKYIDAAIKTHNSLDSINPKDDKLNPVQQVEVSKQVVEHLRNIRAGIANKLSEE